MGEGSRSPHAKETGAAGCMIFQVACIHTVVAALLLLQVLWILVIIFITHSFVHYLLSQVFCVAGPNPTTFLRCMFNQNKNQSCLYVRGDDMPNFPARSLCEEYMPIHLLPYTAGVSSTSLREVFLKRKHQVKNNKFEEDDYSLFYWAAGMNFEIQLSMTERKALLHYGRMTRF